MQRYEIFCCNGHTAYKQGFFFCFRHFHMGQRWTKQECNPSVSVEFVFIVCARMSALMLRLWAIARYQVEGFFEFIKTLYIYYFGFWCW
jgi:hypothetical protein